jgi:hypothetical protein
LRIASFSAQEQLFIILQTKTLHAGPLLETGRVRDVSSPKEETLGGEGARPENVSAKLRTRGEKGGAQEEEAMMLALLII